MRVHEFGPPDVIRAEQLEVPEPAPDEVLVRIHAAGVGPWDGWIRGGRSVLDQPLPLTLGSDVAGVVERAGSETAGFMPGDEVYGATNPRFTGGYAEFGLCKAAMIARKPRNLSFVEAASAPVIGVTAWQMLFDEAKLSEGQSVVIHGAAGNVGRYTVMLAHAAGLRIVGTARAADLGAVRALGAGEAVEAPGLAGLEGSADAALDLVGGEFQPLLLRSVKPGGVFVSAVAAPSQTEAVRRDVRASFMLVHVETRYLDELTVRFEDGRLRPNVGRVLPLGEARLAHEMLEGSRPSGPGKIVLAVR
jgi:NADPH:quinone reductase-like Zn-dependent oxidoreductase